MASCRQETEAYRQCLKDHRRDASTRCKSLALTLEGCRDRFFRGPTTTTDRAGGTGGGVNRSQQKDGATTSGTGSTTTSTTTTSTTFDGTRVIPHPKCRIYNAQVQHCLKWKQGDETQCRDLISQLKSCMEQEKGIVVPPTASDKIWSDYREKNMKEE